MKWLKKWYYLILFLCAGGVYLGCVDRWQVYAGPAATVKGWYIALTEPYGAREPSDSQQGGDPPVGEEDRPSSQGPDRESRPEAADPGGGSGVQPGDDRTPPGGDTSEGEGPDADGPGGEGTGEDGQEGQEEPGVREPSYFTVEDDYFADAVFIGDSRTVGMFEYGGLEEISTFYASTGLTVYKMFTSEIVSVPGQKKKITIEEALQQNSFAKIYFMIGINEMGTGTVDTFIEKYEEVLGRLRELQPQAIIYIQGIMKVTTDRSQEGDYINNEGIIARNERIAQLADNEHIFYLDVNPLICDESGGMEPSYTFDGVHLKAKFIEIWKQHLKEHAVEPPAQEQP